MCGAVVALPAQSACPPNTPCQVPSHSVPASPQAWQSEQRAQVPRVPDVSREPEHEEHRDHRGSRHTIYVVPLYNVGIAWSSTGNWAIRIGATLPEAINEAIMACSALGAPCTDSGLSLGADRPACYALFRSGASLYGQDALSLGRAISEALYLCQRNGTACALQAAACNTPY